MVRVPRMGYIQYRNVDGSGNTHQSRNQEIQRLVRFISTRRDAEIHQRLLDLKVNDFMWQEGEVTFNHLLAIPNPPEESHCTITYEPKT